jgi:hypothetical protein
LTGSSTQHGLPTAPAKCDRAVVDRDHQVHGGDLRRERIEELRRIDLAVPMDGVAGLALQHVEVAADVAILQRDEGAVRRFQDRPPQRQVDGADGGAVAIAAAPGNADQPLAGEQRPVAVCAGVSVRARLGDQEALAVGQVLHVGAEQPEQLAPSPPSPGSGSGSQFAGSALRSTTGMSGKLRRNRLASRVLTSIVMDLACLRSSENISANIT